MTNALPLPWPYVMTSDGVIVGQAVQDDLTEIAIQIGFLTAYVPAIVIGSTGAPGFQNSWTNFGGGYAAASYYRDVGGVVRLDGVVKSGTIGSAIFTLPAAFWPATAHIYAVVSNGAFGRVDVLSNGDVIPIVGSNAYVSLSGITFRAGQ